MKVTIEGAQQIGTLVKDIAEGAKFNYPIGANGEAQGVCVKLHSYKKGARKGRGFASLDNGRIWYANDTDRGIVCPAGTKLVLG